MRSNETKSGGVDCGSYSEPQKKSERSFPRADRTSQTKMKRKAHNTGRTLNFM